VTTGRSGRDGVARDGELDDQHRSDDRPAVVAARAVRVSPFSAISASFSLSIGGSSASRLLVVFLVFSKVLVKPVVPLCSGYEFAELTG
jgi:hypothetical protein